MDIVNGTRLVVSLKTWANGFRVVEGIECDSVGVRFVGGSYL